MPVRDLTHPIDSSTWTYPDDPPVSVEPHAPLEADGYRVSALSLGTHTGTHLDAPSHTGSGGATVEALPVEQFAMAARVVRLDGDLGPRQPIDPDHLPRVPDDCDCLVLDTGWADHWGTDRYLDHPYLGAGAAARCADGGLVIAVDAPSVDPSASADAAPGEPDGLAAHHALLGAGLPVVENLTNLGDLPDRCELRAYPLPVAGGDGSPVRAVAAW